MLSNVTDSLADRSWPVMAPLLLIANDWFKDRWRCIDSANECEERHAGGQGKEALSLLRKPKPASHHSSLDYKQNPDTY